MNRTPKNPITRDRMLSLGLEIWVNPDLVDIKPRATMSAEELMQAMAEHYTKLQLENPEELEERLKCAWIKILECKPDSVLAEEAERLGIL